MAAGPPHDWQREDEGEESVHDLAAELRRHDIKLPEKGQFSKSKQVKDPHKMKRVSSLVILHQDKHRKRGIFAKIYLHPGFENGALGLILLNAMWIGFDIDWNGREGSGIPKEFFEGGESTFCTLFLMELLVRFFAYRHKEQFFYDPMMRKWNLFDLGLVGLMVMDTWVLTYVIKVDTAQLQLLSVFRLIRLLRMTRILRMVPELGMMVKSMVAALRSVASTCLLGMGIMYIFAILLTQWVKSYGSAGKCIGYESDVCLQTYFGSIALSFLALTQILVFDDTFEIVRPIFQERFIMGVALILYILLVSFTVLNMLIGIICDIVSETTASEREKQLKTRVEEIFRNMDVDESGTVTRDEFQDGNAIEQLATLGIDQGTSKNAFDILDLDRDGQLASDEFIRMIFKCLHPPHAEEIMEIEARVDRLADVVGLGRKAIAVLEKAPTRASQRISPAIGLPSTPGMVPENSGRSPWIVSVEAAAEHAAKKALLAKTAMAEKATEEAEYAQRLRSLGSKLGDVLLLAEAGCLSTKNIPQANGTAHDSSLLMLEDGANAPSDAQGGPTDGKGPPPMPSAGLMTILRPSMRALDARLHALRAECKAAGMRNAGNLAGRQGEDLLPRHSLQPLDELISEVLSRLDATSKAMRPPSSTAALIQPPVALRQRDVLALEDGRWNPEGTAVNAERSVYPTAGAGRDQAPRQYPDDQQLMTLPQSQPANDSRFDTARGRPRAMEVKPSQYRETSRTFTDNTASSI